MEEATIDLAKTALDSELVRKVYEDTASPAAKEIGGIGADVVKAFRLFTAPIQFLACAQDRLAAFLDHVRAKVPAERQAEAKASIAGPVLMNMRFIEDDNPLRELYAELLAKAIDKDRQKEAHPGFIKVIEQMSPQEAAFLLETVKARRFAKGRDTQLERRIAAANKIAKTHPQKTTGVDRLCPLDNLRRPLVQEHTDRLDALGIIVAHPDGVERGARYTRFGTRFIRACLPVNADWEPGAKPRTTEVGETEIG